MPFNIETVFGAYMIRYKRLEELFNNHYFYNPTCANINLYIDFDSISRRLYSSNIEKYQYTDIIIGVINICAHYRKYFKTIGVRSNIYIIRSTSLSNTRFVSNYDAKRILVMKNKPDISNKINQALSVLTKMIPMIPNVYLYTGRTESAVVALNISRTRALNNNIEHIFLSTDSNGFKLCDFNNFSFLRPHKANNTDDSFIVGINTNDSFIWDKYFTIKGVYSKRYEIIPKKYMSLFETFYGNKERQLQSYIPYNVILKYINDVIKISNGEDINLITLYNYVDVFDIKLPNKAVILNIFKAVDLNAQLEIMEDIPRFEIDINEPHTLSEINFRFFNGELPLEDFY